MKTDSVSQKLYKRFIKVPYLIGYLSVRDTIHHDGIEHAGYLSFLFILSLFPFLIFFASIASFFGDSYIVENFINIVTNSIPDNINSEIKERANEIIHSPPQSLLTIAFIGIIWTASSSVEGIRTILNRAYRVHLPPPYIWRRLLSILHFFIITLIISVAMILLILIPAILGKIEQSLKINFAINYNWLYIRQILAFGIILLSISSVYYIIPNISQNIGNTFPGSVICVFLMSMIVKLFSIYLTNFNQFNLLYGSLAGIIGTLVFFYLSSLSFIVGAQFNYHFNRVVRTISTNKK